MMTTRVVMVVLHSAGATAVMLAACVKVATSNPTEARPADVETSIVPLVGPTSVAHSSCVWACGSRHPSKDTSGGVNAHVSLPQQQQPTKAGP
jgi:hypothetical protein